MIRWLTDVVSCVLEGVIRAKRFEVMREGVERGNERVVVVMVRLDVEQLV
jgi:hypothetical protein